MSDESLAGIPGLPASSAARDLGVSPVDVDRWVAWREEHGNEATLAALAADERAVADLFGWSAEHMIRVIQAHNIRVSEANPVVPGSSMLGIGANLPNVGVMNGRTEADWCTALGRQPVAITVMPNNMRLLQWRSGTFKIQIIGVLFDATTHRFVSIANRVGC